MNELAFDTLAYVKRLKSVGFTEEQAEAQAYVLKSLIEEKLATKKDIKEIEASLKRDLKEMEVSLKHDIKDLEKTMIIKLGAMVVVAISIVATLVKIL